MQSLVLLFPFRFCNKTLNYICGNINFDARLCNVNLCLMSRLYSMCSLPNFTIAKVLSAIVVCNLSNHGSLTIKERNLVPLELIHSDRRETWHLLHDVFVGFDCLGGNRLAAHPRGRCGSYSGDFFFCLM